MSESGAAGTRGATGSAGRTGTSDPEAWAMGSYLACRGCGWQAPPRDPAVLRCPRAVPGGEIDHVIVRRLDPTRVSSPTKREGMLVSGGYPVVVDEPTLEAANDLALECTGIPVDHTGSSGPAGPLELLRRGSIASDESVAVLFTGIHRSGPPASSQHLFHAGTGAKATPAWPETTTGQNGERPARPLGGAPWSFGSA